MIHVGIVIGSTRPNRKGEVVARWVHGHAAKRTDATFELIDIATYALPLLDEPLPPSQGKYAHEHTKRWSAKVTSCDAFVFVTPEYNHGTSGALKNALDFVFHEWSNKAAGFVSYGSAGGVRAVESLRMVMGELSVADVRSAVALTLSTDWEDFKVFKPAARHEKTLTTMLDQVVAWGGALKPLRAPR